MHKTTSFSLIILILFLTACSEEGDTSPPIINITEPAQNALVSEVTTIKCNVTDNDSVHFVELWVDSIALGIIDSVVPYEFLWNTVPYQDSTEHVIMIVAEDMSGNISYSKPLYLLVDNSLSAPRRLDILSIDYTRSEMTIVFEKSRDEDFYKYSLLHSESINSEKTQKAEILSLVDTSVQISDFNPVDSSWYWVEVEDIHGYRSQGSGYFVIDDAPQASTLSSIEFSDSLFIINWTPNDESDFQSYSLFESNDPEMYSPIKIFETDDISTTNFFHNQISNNQYRYYKLIVRDHWGLSAESNVETGCSWLLFNNVYQEASYDFARSLVQTSDDGYVIVGGTSFLGDQYSNILLMKLDDKGEKQWSRDYTFSDTDNLNFVNQLSDGNFIAVGSTISNTNSSKDLLLVQFDPLGNMISQHSYGGNQDEVGQSVDISDGGAYIISGQKVDQNSGYNVCYVLKIQSSGEIIWSKTFGGSYNDYGYSVISLNDGGCIVAGSTRSYGDVNGDAWVIRTDSDGTILWENTYGGSSSESIRSIKKTNDGGYILVGHTDSYGSGYDDAYLLKISIQGEMQWYKTFGGQGTDNGRNVVETSDGSGYLIFGYSDSYSISGSYDLWVIKTDALGNEEWHKTFGGVRDDKAFWGIQTADGGCAIGGYSRSNNNNIPNIYIVKTDDQGSSK